MRAARISPVQRGLPAEGRQISPKVEDLAEGGRTGFSPALVGLVQNAAPSLSIFFSGRL